MERLEMIIIAFLLVFICLVVFFGANVYLDSLPKPSIPASYVVMR